MILKIAFLYPQLMNLYGDTGNIRAYCKRCSWRGIKTQIQNIGVGDQANFNEFDFIFIGGGQYREQKLICKDLNSKGDQIVNAVENGTALLAICGGYQLLGNYFQTSEEERLNGLGIFDIYSKEGEMRNTGNIASRFTFKFPKDYIPNQIGKTLVGFENHLGETYLDKKADPLGRIISGFGNNGEKKTEGCRYKNAFGTYLHGPILPKNPHFADYLIHLSLKQKYGSISLKQLCDIYEKKAHKKALEVILKKNRMSGKRKKEIKKHIKHLEKD